MRDTTREPLLAAIAGLAGPAILSFVLPNFYHVNDAWFLGQVGKDELNAMGLFQILSIANFGFILTLARGTQSLVARRYGAGNLAGSQLALAQGLRLALFVLLGLGAVEWLFVPQILAVMGGQGGTITAGTEYVRHLLPFFPALFVSPLVEFSLQGLGDTRTPFKLQLLAVCVNTALNWLLVLPHEIALTAGAARLDGWLALPGLGPLLSGEPLSFGGFGAAGAAVATGSSRLVSAVLGLTLLVRRDRLSLLLARRSYRHDGRVAREILRVGLPTGSSTFLYAVVAFVLTRIIADFGQDALGAYAIGFRGVESVAFMVVLGFGVATGTVAAQAVGAGRLDRARAAAHVGVALGGGAMLLPMAVFLAWPHELAGLFTDSESIVAIAAGYITIMAFCQVPQALEMIYGDAMAGAGSSSLAAAVSIPGNVLRVPLALWFTGGLGLGLHGVWYAILVSACLKGAGMVVLFVSGAWEKGMARGRSLLDADGGG